MVPLPTPAQRSVYVPAQKPLGATDQAVSITLSRSEMKLLPGCTTELTAEVMPWGLEDKSVTWFSSNESVAQVKDGVVTALAEGSATIRAVTNAEPHLEAVCTVTVAEAEDIHFSRPGARRDRKPVDGILHRRPEYRFLLRLRQNHLGSTAVGRYPVLSRRHLYLLHDAMTPWRRSIWVLWSPTGSGPTRLPRPRPA